MSLVDLLFPQIDAGQWAWLARHISYFFSIPFWLLSFVLLLMRPSRWVDRMGLVFKFTLALVSVRYFIEWRTGQDLSQTFYTAFVFILAWIVGMIYAILLIVHAANLVLDGYRERSRQ